MKKFDAGQLRLARRNAGLKIKDVAAVLHLAPSTIAAKENGSIRVGADELSAFAYLYGVSCEQFFVVPIKSLTNKV